MEEEEYWAVLDGDEIKPESVSPNDFDLDMDLMIVADPKLATDKQREERAQRIFEILMSNPMIQQDPAAVYTVYRNLLIAFDVPNIDEILPPPPPPAPAAMAGPAGAPTTPGGIPEELLAALGGQGAAPGPLPAEGGAAMAPPNPNLGIA